MERYICIHGHFYQPPRENAWLEAIEIQSSAYPYHDWNERITAECYATNAASRIMNDRGRIARITNNYGRISFNFGPTLLAWLEDYAPDVYRAVLDGDAAGQARFGGHGTALAQAYNHIIMPLANRRDKETQILWGIADFRQRFRRHPEGMWLPEAAVDLETLDLLAQNGIGFTILSPGQAGRAREIDGGDWQDVAGGNIDPTRAYVQHLPSGRRIALFFYDGPISQAVAFEKLLDNGEWLARRLEGGFREERSWPQLMHIATDGESYGHHHRHGDMALSWALRFIEEQGIATLTNYGQYLETHPPTHEVEIVENTSWSCVHGVERWRSACGCNSGGHSGWHQNWRAPLRAALDGLRDAAAALYQERAGELLKDPWAARDAYITLVLDRSRENMEGFLEEHAVSPSDGVADALRALELQRHAMLMYTSCGWFFDELSGIETVQVIHYAGRVIQLARDLWGEDLETRFLEDLALAPSNLPEHGDGRAIYEEWVRPAMLDLPRVGAHWAISSLFEDYEDHTHIYCYQVDRQEYRRMHAGRAGLVLGRARVASRITREQEDLVFCVISLGDHNVHCGLRRFTDVEDYGSLVEPAVEAFRIADIPGAVVAIDHAFGPGTYTLRSLFRDEQQKISATILESVLSEAEMYQRQLIEHHAPLMRFLNDAGLPKPRVLTSAAEFVLNADLNQLLGEEDLQPEAVAALMQEVRQGGVWLDSALLELTFRKNLEGMSRHLRLKPNDKQLVNRLVAAVGILKILPFDLHLYQLENVGYELMQAVYPDFRRRARRGGKAARELVKKYRFLAGELFHLEDPETAP